MDAVRADRDDVADVQLVRKQIALPADRCQGVVAIEDGAVRAAVLDPQLPFVAPRPCGVGRFRQHQDGGREAVSAGVGGLMIFGVPEHKDATGSGADDPDGVLNAALRRLHDELGDDTVLIITPDKKARETLQRQIESLVRP